MKFRSGVFIAALLVATTGCVRVDVGDNVPTIGEELIQLEQARALGAISEEELSQLRRTVIGRL